MYRLKVITPVPLLNIAGQFMQRQRDRVVKSSVLTGCFSFSRNRFQCACMLVNDVSRGRMFAVMGLHVQLTLEQYVKSCIIQ